MQGQPNRDSTGSSSEQQQHKRMLSSRCMHPKLLHMRKTQLNLISAA
jgi:hypothetical protein